MDYLLWSSALLIPCLPPSYSLLCTTATLPVLLGWKATGRKQTGKPEQCISARPCSGHLSKKSSRQRPFLRSCTSSPPYVWGRVCLVCLRFQCDGLFSLRPPLSPPQTLLLSSNRTSRSLKKLLEQPISVVHFWRHLTFTVSPQAFHLMAGAVAVVKQPALTGPKRRSTFLLSFSLTPASNVPLVASVFYQSLTDSYRYYRHSHSCRFCWIRR